MKALLRQEYIASCEKRGREIDGVSDNPVSLFVGDYEGTEAAKSDLQKLERLHQKVTVVICLVFDTLSSLEVSWERKGMGNRGTTAMETLT
jgi:hypothetical protein